MHASGVDRAARRSTPRPHRGDTVPPPTAEAGPTTLHTNAAPIVEHPVPHHLGVRRCLPHRPGRAGNPGRARWGAPHRDRQRPRLGATVFAAPVARSRAAAPRPDRGGRRIAGRASICHGWAAGPCCRGRALPDLPVLPDRQSPGGALVTVPRGSPRRPIHVTGAAAPQGDGRGTPRPCTGWASIPSRAHARRGSAVRRPPCRGRAAPDPSARRAGNGRAASSAWSVLPGPAVTVWATGNRANGRPIQCVPCRWTTCRVAPTDALTLQTARSRCITFARHIVSSRLALGSYPEG